MKILFVELRILLLAASVIMAVLILDSTGFSQNGARNNSKNDSNGKVAERFDSYAFQILTLVNLERTSRGLNQLSWDDEVAKIAREYSKRMAKENFFGHFDSNNQSVLERAKAAKLKKWSKIGENLFSIEPVKNFDRFAIKNWMKSPTHRQNILDPEWTTTGIGITESADGEIFITQIFIKR